MRVKGLKSFASGLLLIAGCCAASQAQTTTTPPPPATQKAPAAPAEATPPAMPAPSPSGKTTDQIPPSNEVPPPAMPPAAPVPGAEQPADQGEAEPALPDGEGAEVPEVPEELSIGEIPDIKIVDLTPEKAKAAIDTYGLLKDKFKDARLEDYETLQEFVDKDPAGKEFDTDVKAAGFSDVENWNQTITTVSTTYSNIINDQTADTQAQIAEVEKDNELAKDMKDKLLASLRALIPTENNSKVVKSLMDDPAYAEKLKQLESEDE